MGVNWIREVEQLTQGYTVSNSQGLRVSFCSITHCSLLLSLECSLRTHVYIQHISRSQHQDKELKDDLEGEEERHWKISLRIGKSSFREIWVEEITVVLHSKTSMFTRILFWNVGRVCPVIAHPTPTVN